MAARATCGCGWTRTYPTEARARANAARHVCKAEDGVRRATRRHRCARCGFEQVYENAGAAEARYWFGKHSCRKREEAMLRATMAAQREALIDRTPKPCLHKVANHQHGTRACYVLDRCRCQPCSKANAEAETWRERQKAYGRYQKYVPAGPVRDHIQALRDSGMGLKTIAKRSGVSNGSLTKIVYGTYAPAEGPHKGRNGAGKLLRGPARRVLRETAEKLYALDPDWGTPLELADGAKADAETSAAASRKLQALVALGWSMSKVGGYLGMGPRNATLVVRGERRLLVGTVRKVDEVFERLCMTLPPETNQRDRIAASRSRRYAREHGWLPPLALDLDDEPAQDGDDDTAIDEAAVLRRLNGDRSIRLTHAEAAEVHRRAIARGMNVADMERHLGLKPERYTTTREAS